MSATFSCVDIFVSLCNTPDWTIACLLACYIFCMLFHRNSKCVMLNWSSNMILLLTCRCYANVSKFELCLHFDLQSWVLATTLQTWGLSYHVASKQKPKTWTKFCQKVKCIPVFSLLDTCIMVKSLEAKHTICCTLFEHKCASPSLNLQKLSGLLLWVKENNITIFSNNNFLHL